VPAPDRAGDPGHRVGDAGAAEQGARVVQVHAVQRGGEPVRIALPDLLAVGDDVQPGPLLVAQREQGGVPLSLLQVRGADPPQFTGPDPGRQPVAEPVPVDEPVRLRVAADQRGGKEHARQLMRRAARAF
jgi:hypothetical protein